MRPVRSLYYLISAILLFCAIFPAGRAIAEEFDWFAITPSDFLSYLRDRVGYTVFIEKTNLPPEGWIRERDVTRLMRLIERTDPAAPVALSTGPFLPRQVSTVGTEAMFLIEGFRSNKYPPTQCSIYDFRPNVSTYKRWWSDRVFSGKSRTKIGGYRSFRSSPSPSEVLKDAKTINLSILDALLFKKDVIQLGASRTNVLVNRLTNDVEYVWSPPYKHYIRLKFVSLGIRKLYDKKRK